MVGHNRQPSPCRLGVSKADNSGRVRTSSLTPAFMLRLLFQSIEQGLGQSLSQVSWLVFGGGLTLLVFVILVPLWRIRMQYVTARTGMEQRWVMTCGHCGRQALVSGRKCGTCGNDLGIPWMVRLWTASTRKSEGTFLRRLKWGVHLLGSAAFLLFSVWIVTATGSLAPQGALHRLFLGLAFVALAVFGWLAGRALGMRRHGLLARAGDAVMALAAIGTMAVALFLADSARPQRLAGSPSAYAPTDFGSHLASPTRWSSGKVRC